MSEEAIVIKRNDIEQRLTDIKIKRGDDKGKTYPCLVVTKENIEAVLGWTGVDNVVNILNAKFGQMFQAFKKSNTSEDGVFNLAGFIKSVEELSSAALSKGQLLDMIQEKTAELTSLDFAALGEEGIKIAQTLSQEIQSLQAQHDARSRAPKKKVEAENTEEEDTSSDDVEENDVDDDTDI